MLLTILLFGSTRLLTSTLVYICFQLILSKVTKCVLYALSKSPQKVHTSRTYRQNVRSQKIHTKIQMLYPKKFDNENGKIKPQSKVTQKSYEYIVLLSQSPPPCPGGASFGGYRQRSLPPVLGVNIYVSAHLTFSLPATAHPASPLLEV